MTNKVVTILLVEDNEADIRLTREALHEGGVKQRLLVANDGLEALAILRASGTHPDRPRPDLILLDLNLPKVNGHDVLAEIKRDPVLRRIPVLILTTSRAEEDILRAYDLQASCYITKPVDFDDFVSVVRRIDALWLTVARLIN